MRNRLDKIVSLVDEHSFLSVTELSQQCNVSEMTIRRDLSKLDEAGQIQRVYGGAKSIHATPVVETGEAENEDAPLTRPVGKLIKRIGVLIATPVNLKADGALLELVSGKNIPIIAESQALENQKTLVSVDNYQAGRILGQWAGQYAKDHFGQAHALILTSHLLNATLRSRGFAAGFCESYPEADIALSVDVQSRLSNAYQTTLDALTVHNQLNVIFAVNDIIALGAINACKEKNISPDHILVCPFGLEGDTMMNFLADRQSYVKAGLAMFPEIVGPSCIEAAIAAYNHQLLPSQLTTPVAVLTSDTLYDYYQPAGTGWTIRWEDVIAKVTLPIPLDPHRWPAGTKFPRKIGFIIPFMEHEWYQNLSRSIQEHAQQYSIDYEIVDVEQNIKEEIVQNRFLIAKRAAEMIKPGEAILIDGGPIADCLAEALASKEGLTIITNSFSVFNILKDSQNVLVCIGGVYRNGSQTFVGPTAESMLREMRADRMFLQVAGISFQFGLSHTNISEVTMKRAMMSVAHEVVLLADSSSFGVESVIQIAPITAIQHIITDDALPASLRLELNKEGIPITLAGV
jgi:DeoR/GlpR family transcriptional regulator of sugar metabolism